MTTASAVRRRPPQVLAAAVHPAEPRFSDRAVTLALLGIPVWLSLFALLLAIVLTASGPAIEPGSLKQYTATFAYTTLLVAGLFLPSYVGAFAWYWWRSRSEGAMGRRLARMPLIAAGLVWCPTLLISGSNGYFDSMGLLQAYLLLAAVTLVGGYMWVGSVRLTLRLWRKI